jgi:hypothetical protein
MTLFRFKAMIRPNMGLTFNESRDIADRKSVAMVGYLRARRALSDPTMFLFDKLHTEAKRRSRRDHLRLAKRKATP